MKSSLGRVHAGVLIALIILMSCPGYAQELSSAEKSAVVDVETPSSLPQLADIIPLSTELTVRLALLENQLKDGLDAGALEAKYDGIQKNIEELTGQFEQLRESSDYQQNALLDLSNAVKQASKSVEETSRMSKQAISQLGDYRTEWQEEKKQWAEWERVLVQEKEFDQLQSTFEKANQTIDNALERVLPKLEAMLRIQEKGGAINARLKIFNNEVETRIAEERHGALVRETPLILSTQFFAQFRNRGLWAAAKSGVYNSSWPFSSFIDRQGWVVLIHCLLFLFVIVAVYKKRSLLKNSRRWRFLYQRMISAGFFFGYVATVVIYEKQGTPNIFKQALSIMAVIALARLLTGLVDVPWKKQFVYGLMIVLTISNVVEMFNIPMPLVRLFTIITALVAVVFCLRWVRQNIAAQESKIYTLGLRFSALLFAAVIVVDLAGKAPLSSYMFTAFLRSITAVLFFMLLAYAIRGALESVFSLLPAKGKPSDWADIETLVQRVGLLIEIVLFGLVLFPVIFVIWGAYPNFEGAIQGLLGLGFNLGTQRISAGLLLLAAGFVYSAFLLSWIVQNFILDRILLKRNVVRGVRVSIKRMVHYVLITLGFLLAIASLGLELTELTIMLSALGVGVGFGLQGVVNNFVSGLILLFERPVRVGDYIDVNNTLCEIKQIGLRATTVQTFDQADVIIPNADLVANQVTNWTLSNRKVRLIIPVGVAYGSDVPLVIKTLKSIAEPHPIVADQPAPQVLFLSFGESSLDFELRVWVKDVDQKLVLQNELHQEIDRRFREVGIEIPFPQRDLHFYSREASSINLQSPNT